MENKYITTKKGFKMLVETVVVNDFLFQVYETKEKRRIVKRRKI